MPMTLGLQNLRRQTDEAFPNRDRTSDGGIGDAAHRARTSGHNPDDTPGSKPAWDGDPDSVPEWRAWDMDADLRTPGVTTQDYVNHLIGLRDLDFVVRYLIFDGKIYHEEDDFEPRPYNGADKHHEHLHVEGAWSQGSDNDATFDFHLEELVMPTADEIRKIFKEEIAAARKSIAAEVRLTARTNARFLSDTEHAAIVNDTAAAVLAKTQPPA